MTKHQLYALRQDVTKKRRRARHQREYMRKKRAALEVLIGRRIFPTFMHINEYGRRYYGQKLLDLSTLYTTVTENEQSTLISQVF